MKWICAARAGLVLFGTCGLSAADPVVAPKQAPEAAPSSVTAPAPAADQALLDRVAILEAHVKSLQAELAQLRQLRPPSPAAATPARPQFVPSPEDRRRFEALSPDARAKFIGKIRELRERMGKMSSEERQALVVTTLREVEAEDQAKPAQADPPPAPAPKAAP
jgi:hypothetical protein